MIRSPWPSLEPYPSVPAWELMAQVARIDPDRPALVEASGTITTYAELLNASRRAACFLQREGNLAGGETVAIVAEPARDTVALMHGVLMAGGKLTTFSDSMSEDEIVARLADSETVLAFASDPLRQMLVGSLAGGRLPSVRALYANEGFWEVTQGEGVELAPVPIDPGRDVGILAYTSGTGGMPKGAMLTHANLNASALQLGAAGVGGPKAVALSLRVFWSTMRRLVATGATCVVVPRFDPDEVLFLIEKYGVNQLLGRPRLLDALARAKAWSRRDVSSLRYVESTAEALHERIANGVNKAFECGVRQGYHLTEASGSANRTAPGEASWRTVGRPVPDTEEKLIDLETGGEVPLGSEGELLIRGPQVMAGYWRCPEATAAALLPGGWLRTGDLARQDQDGNLYIVDRIKELIKVYGLPVVPAQLESILLGHPSVREAAVIPVPDHASGEAPKAFVVLEPGAKATKSELLQLVRTTLIHRKRLREVQFVQALPKNSSGKVMRRVLVEQERRAFRGYHRYLHRLTLSTRPEALREAAAELASTVRRLFVLIVGKLRRAATAGKTD
jgi:acyl-CoA synthetase (AMP-forming)/AMP-acid ligase II